MTTEAPIKVIALFGIDPKWTNAVFAIAVSVAISFVLDKGFKRRNKRVEEAVLRGEISPQVNTRVRFVEHFVVTGTIIIGVAIGLLQFKEVQTVAEGVLVSSAILAVVVGFAARQPLANLSAGIMLAIAQPLRVGDWITFEDHYGVVEEVRLSYTRLRTSAERNIMIPNEHLASGILLNDTLGSERVALEVEVWLPHSVEADQAITALSQENGIKVGIAEVSVEGFRLWVRDKPYPPIERVQAASDLRARALRRLRQEGLLN